MSHRSCSAVVLSLSLLALPSAGTAAGERDPRLGIASSLILLDEDLAGESSAIEPELGLWTLFPFLGPFEGRVELGYSKFQTETFRGETRSLVARAMAEYAWGAERRDYWYVAAGGGFVELEFDRAQRFTSALASAAFGRSFFMTPTSRLRWELRAERSLAEDGLSGEDLFQVGALVGWSWALGRSDARDADGDGVRDSADRCPGTGPGVVVDRQGCPVDSAAPQTPTPPVEPAEEQAPDGDGDGVPDASDRCPHTLLGIDVDETGCPRDDDGDGVHDGLGMDKCPGTPAGAHVDTHGCPLDGDGDGVYDGLDQCPKTPSGTRVDETGCPAS